MENDKFVSLGTLNKLAKELRQKSLADIEQQEEFIQRVEDMFGGKSLRYITQEEYNNLAEEEKNRMDVVWNIIDADGCFSGDYNFGAFFTDCQCQEVSEASYCKGRGVYKGYWRIILRSDSAFGQSIGYTSW